MTTIVASLLITLDGRNANDVVVPDAEEHEEFNQLFATSDLIVFDRSDYELLVPYWDEFDVDDPEAQEVERAFARSFRTKPRIVIAPDLEQVDPLAELVRDDPVARLSRLRQEDRGRVLISAGADLLAILFGERLIDEVHVLVRPWLVGGTDSPTNGLLQHVPLVLQESRLLASGTLVLRYNVAQGEPASA